MNSNDTAKMRPQDLDREVVIVDVGCRWGFADSFIDELDFFRLYGFDPDKDECERLEKLYNSDRITLVPLALADSKGESSLYLTKDPACSSMYIPDSQITDKYLGLECAAHMGEITVKHDTMDNWARQFGIPHIDHIKIDTQGSELLVLKGCKRLLGQVRSLEVEVEFNPIYKGQPLFADVDDHLRKNGFVLWKLSNLVHYGCEGENRMELGEDRIHHDGQSQKIQKHGGQLYWADAHYVRQEIVQNYVASDEQRLRDIVLLKCLNHHDLVRRLQATTSIAHEN